jgi:4-amino-4-deoxychorismate lyase
MNLVYNSDVYPAEGWSLPPTDRAFQYGDGLFETIRYENGRIWFWPDHYDRLAQGMAALSLDVPAGFSAVSLQQHLLRLIDLNGLNTGPARLKLQVWRQPGGLYTPTTSAANWLLTAQPGQPFAITQKTRLGTFDQVRLSASAVSRFKTLNALPYVLAGLYKQQRNLDDVLLLDHRGYVAECVASSLFWQTDSHWSTPSLDTGCIDGIIRRQLLRAWPVRVGLFLPEALNVAETIFCANVNGIQVFRGTLPTDFSGFDGSADEAALHGFLS